MKNEVGMAGSKSTQTRDIATILYIPTLAFLNYYAPINVNVFAFAECGIWETFRLFPSCHDGLGLSVLIQLYYYWLFLHPSKSKRRDV